MREMANSWPMGLQGPQQASLITYNSPSEEPGAASEHRSAQLSSRCQSKGPEAPVSQQSMSICPSQQEAGPEGSCSKREAAPQ